MSVKKIHCSALIQLLKRWMACSNILLNKSLARILISYPGLNEYEIFYLVLINKYGDLKINGFFCNRQTKRNLLRRQWIDVTFMPCACKGYTPTSKIKTFNSNVKQKVLNGETR